MAPEELSAVEVTVCAAFRVGTQVDLTDQPDRRVRAEVLTALLLGTAAWPDSAPAGPASALRLRGACVTGALRLAFATVTAPILIEDAEFAEPPDLYWARLSFTSFAGSRMPALHAPNVQVDGHLRLLGCDLDGKLDLSGAAIKGALICSGATVRGTCSLYQASVGGNALFDDAALTAAGQRALAAGNLTIAGGFYCRGAKVDGEISLRHARVSGAATFSNSHLRNPDGITLRLDRATIEGGLFLLGMFHSEGEIRAIGAVVGRTFTLKGARLTNPGGRALWADAIRVDGSLDARDGLHVIGETSLLDAVVTGPVHFEGATLSNPDSAALTANGLSVGTVLNLCDGFTASGGLRLSGVRVGSRLCLDDARLTATDRMALRLWRTEAAELALRWATPPVGAVDLRHARVGVLRDHPESWPEVVHLSGLVYESLEPELDARTRLGWLARDGDGYRPQSYEQLALLYRQLGHTERARTVLLAKQRRQNAAGPPHRRAWGLLQDAVVGYGYRPVRAAVWLLSLLAIGTIAFIQYPPRALDAAVAPRFNAFAYTLDLLLPVVDLGQQSAYSPADGWQWLGYGLILAGLVLATTVATGFARLLRRD